MGGGSIIPGGGGIITDGGTVVVVVVVVVILPSDVLGTIACPLNWLTVVVRAGITVLVGICMPVILGLSIIPFIPVVTPIACETPLAPNIMLGIVIVFIFGICISPIPIACLDLVIVIGASLGGFTIETSVTPT